MALRDLNIQPEYRTKISNIPKEFIVPLLQEGVLYRRAVGFFSSSALMEISKGIGTLISNGGRIQLVASPNLSKEDIEAIDKGYKTRRDVISSALLRELPDVNDLSLEEKDRFNLLANLIANGFMDIKIAVVDDSNGLGIYHEKLGLVEDASGDVVAFTGSMNESKTAMLDNYGAVDVFKSWNDPEGRVEMKSAAFASIWDGTEIGIATYEFPEVSEAIKANYLQGSPKLDIDRLDKDADVKKEIAGQFGYPRIPQFEGFSIREYQNEAVEKWLDESGRGLFDMATGTGKTITALIALTRLYEKLDGRLFVIIACPQKHLVEQWVEDLELFGVKPIVGHSESSQRNWKKMLKDAIADHKLGLENARFACLISTNQSLSSQWMQDCLYRLKSDVLLIADEAHNLGAPNYRKILDGKYAYRLALSATFNRHHDEEGTEVLRQYFGETCIEYPLEQAIHDGMLTKYKYIPVPVTLDEDELEEYQRLTKELGKCFKSSGNGRRVITSRGEIIAQQRARVVAAARNKLNVLQQLISGYAQDEHLLVYCGAASLMDDNVASEDMETDLRQISVVVDMLGNDLGMSVSKFTSEEDMSEREVLKREFSNGNIQALVAIKCLDEGVNIPNIRTAFMLASTTNPKEYIQRRGRLLRLSPGKDYAEIYDLITLPFSTEDASSLPLDDLRGMYTLINNELERGFEFARYALNFADAQRTLDEISDSYRLDELKMLIERREMEA